MIITLIHPDTSSWYSKSRVGIFNVKLKEAGYTVNTIGGKGKFKPRLPKSDIVINHALQACPDYIRKLASIRPNTTFINMNHSAVGYLEHSQSATNRVTSALWAAKRVNNIWYCTHEQSTIDSIIDAGIHRSTYLPIAMNAIHRTKQKIPSNKPNLVMAGRCSPFKNLYNQALTMGLCRDICNTHTCMDLTPELINIFRAIELEPKRHGLLPYNQWINFLQEQADIVLQMSYCESFCIVALEAMQLGIPVIAGSSIRFADPELIIDPNNPTLAKITVQKVLNNYEYYSYRAIELAREVESWQNKGYMSTIDYVHKPYSGRSKELLKRAMQIYKPSVVEVGTRIGTTAKVVLDHHPKVNYTCVDNWAEGDRYSEWIDNTKDRARLLNTSSIEASEEIQDASQDIVFIDANHTKKYVESDIKHWLPKVKVGGWIGGHDYQHPDFPDVKEVVDSVFPNAVKGMDKTWWYRVTS